MKKVFFGGSRQLSRLNEPVRERVDNIISKDYFILLGDANGADKAMQSYLADKSYQRVTVYCAGTVCRNNIGGWQTHFVPSNRKQNDFLHYANRDKKISEEADYGFMLWDGKSKGTLNNIINMLDCSKAVLVYFSPKKSFLTLSSDLDLNDLLAFCDPVDVERLEKKLRLSQRNSSKQHELKNLFNE